MKKSHFIDFIPRNNFHGNKLSSDLKIIDFELYCFDYLCNHYCVTVYILTDVVLDFNAQPCFETMVRIGSGNFCEWLNVQERCYSKLEAYKQHKLIYKKLLKGFYDNELISICDKKYNREEVNVMNNNCP